MLLQLVRGYHHLVRGEGEASRAAFSETLKMVEGEGAGKKLPFSSAWNTFTSTMAWPCA